MAGNIFPLLLVGGAAAYALSSQKASKKKSCPPSTDITMGQMEAAGKIVEPMMKQGADPRVLSNAYIRELLPSGCSRMSKDSHVVLVVKDNEGKDRRFKMTVPDFYMITIIDVAGSFFDNKFIDKATYDRIAREELEWYKKLMGKQFDSTSLGLDPLAEILYESEEGFEGDFKEFDDAPEIDDSGVCPASFELDFMRDLDPINIKLEIPFPAGENEFIEDLDVPSVAVSEFNQGNRDAIDIADKLWASFMPPACQPENKQIRISTIGPKGEMMEVSAPELYIMLFGSTLEAMFLMRLIDMNGLATQGAVMESWWNQNVPGQPFPGKGKNVA